MLARKAIILLLAFILWVGSACSSANSPKQIAAAPFLTPIAEYPGNNSIIYQAYIELQVDDVDVAGRRAEDLVLRYRGYLAKTQSWVVDGRTVSTLELVVPTTNFDRLRSALLQLGTLANETVNGQRIDPPPGLEPYSTITLQLRPVVTRWSPPDPTAGRWDPGRTFQRAFDVFISIFGFLADLVIWVLVVAGPFALIIFIAWLVIRRLRRKA